MTDNETLAYLAGIYEAEGCSVISRSIKLSSKYRVTYQSFIVVRMSDKAPIELYYKYFGGSIGTEKRNKNRKTLHRWYISGKQAATAANKLLPFILTNRKKQAIRCITEFSDTINMHRGSTPLLLDEVTKREMLYQKSKQLNARGKGANNSLSFNDIHIFDIAPNIRYLAGLYEGDGGATISRTSKSYKCYLALSMSDAECVKAFHNYFGGHLSIQEMPGNSKTQFICKTFGHHAAIIAEELLPVVQIKRKRKVLGCIIDFAKTICERGIYQSKELKQHRKYLYQECAKYNERTTCNYEAIKANNTLQLTFL